MVEMVAGARLEPVSTSCACKQCRVNTRVSWCSRNDCAAQSAPLAGLVRRQETHLMGGGGGKAGGVLSGRDGFRSDGRTRR
jgi:hypothetical protein